MLKLQRLRQKNLKDYTRRIAVETFEPKKLLILRILQILQEFSNCDHKLRQNDIISLLKVQYDIECERKAVARNIDFLQQIGRAHV